MRPRNLDEVAGQSNLLGAGKPLRRVLQGGQLQSLILWGPPGSGKTTLARLMANHDSAQMIALSAVTSGVKDIREAIEQAQVLQAAQRRCVLFVDEVHRFNRSQQDAFLPHIEAGTIVFIGATTENPAFELNRALLSRTRVFVLEKLQQPALLELLDNALSDEERGLGQQQLSFADEVASTIANHAQGDARRAMGTLELAAEAAQNAASNVITMVHLQSVLGAALMQFDKHKDHFYDLISALHKSIRGSNCDGTLYWLQRMLAAGVDPHYLLRRLVRIASEDIGNADPRALSITMDAWQAYDRLGKGEGELAIYHAASYLAVAPKSNAVYRAFHGARALVEQFPDAEVPVHLRNAPTGLAKSQGHGKGYRYAHDEPQHYAAGERYLPDNVAQQLPQPLYQPSDNGLEQKIKAKLAHLRQLDEAMRQ